MARQRQVNVYPDVVHPNSSHPRSLRHGLEQFADWLLTHHYAHATIRLRREDLERFILWSEARDLVRIDAITTDAVERYQRRLFAYRKANGTALTVGSQSRALASIRTFFRWAVRAGWITVNPAADVAGPHRVRPLPHCVLTVQETETLLQQPNLETPNGLRDRAMLETFYSTGLRRSELAALCLVDLDRERGLVTVHAGKGGKDRVIPIGDRALAWIDRYLLESRPVLSQGLGGDTLFLTRWGKPFVPHGLGCIVHRYIDAANLGKHGACHALRHTCATVMLDHGADIRYIQQQLGHQLLSTTQIYTQVSDKRLKEVHSQCHPAARLTRDTDPRGR
jgi:integrase/recombinase XerD